jgi:hypothetical protein
VKVSAIFARFREEISRQNANCWENARNENLRFNLSSQNVIVFIKKNDTAFTMLAVSILLRGFQLTQL